MIKRMSAYYEKWIIELWDKLQPFVQVNWFPLNEEVFQSIKSYLCKATLWAIDVDCDASDYSISVVLSQNERTV